MTAILMQDWVQRTAAPVPEERAPRLGLVVNEHPRVGGVIVQAVRADQHAIAGQGHPVSVRNARFGERHTINAIPEADYDPSQRFDADLSDKHAHRHIRPKATTSSLEAWQLAHQAALPFLHRNAIAARVSA